MVDSRHGLTDLDRQLIDFMAERVHAGEISLLVLLTKADKLNHAEAQKALSIARLQAGGGQAMLFSALKKQGLDDVALTLWRWTHPPADTPPATDTDS
jgi:GTP-binding protein